jgi:hypothetical protein
MDFNTIQRVEFTFNQNKIEDILSPHNNNFNFVYGWILDLEFKIKYIKHISLFDDSRNAWLLLQLKPIYLQYAISLIVNWASYFQKDMENYCLEENCSVRYGLLDKIKSCEKTQKLISFVDSLDLFNNEQKNT